ncbi:hypothetical protein QTP70_025505, partial [Hemibagrus guttatus]
MFSSASCHLHKFSDDSAIFGLITDDDDREYRELIQNFVDWYQWNCLQINAGKTRVGVIGIKAGYILDGVPTHRRANTHSHSHTMDNLEMPINLQCMSLDRGRKPEYPEKTHEAWGEHANATHGGGENRTPNPG